MAATHGRLTGRPGVCLTTLGPGALNLTTGAAYAQLGAMPMIMITGQKGILASRQARFQIVDVVAGDEAADQARPPDRLAGDDPDHRARGLPRGAGGTAGTGPSRTARGHRGRRDRRRRPDPAPSGRDAACERSGDRPCGGAHPEGRASPGHARRRGRRGRGRAPSSPTSWCACRSPFSPPRWARARCPAGPSSTWARPRSPSGTMSTRRSSGPTSSSPSATTRSRSRRSSWGRRAAR